jgi:hypothetical protein
MIALFPAAATKAWQADQIVLPQCCSGSEPFETTRRSLVTRGELIACLGVLHKPKGNHYASRKYRLLQVTGGTTNA